MPYIGRPLQAGVRRRYIYAATAGQTSFSGNDSSGISLAYDDNLFLDVYQNGVLLKPVTDYAATTGTSVVLTTGASTDDVLEMLVFDTFGVADTVSAKDGGSFAGNVAMGGTLGVTGAATLSSTLGVTGLITGAAGLTLSDGDITVASGHGINFAATSDSSGTTSSELFDDYEEGTFTPTFATGVTSPVYTEQVGRYTKTGRHVYFEISINLASGSGNSSTVTLGGLPYSPSSAAPYGAAYLCYQQSFETDAPLVYLTNAGGTVITLYNYYTGASFTGNDANGITALLRINGHYMV